MKTIPNLILLAGLAAAISFRAVAQSDDAPPPPPPAESPSDEPAAQPAPSAAPAAMGDVKFIGTNIPAAQAPAAQSSRSGSAPAPTAASQGGGDQLRLNFHGAPLESVLNYLSDAAGFIIVEETSVHGTVDVYSGQPMSKDEAVDLLNSVLDKNGYAAIRNGRTLTIVNKDDAKTKDIPVISGSDPDQIPETDEMVTQIIPVRYVEAAQLIKDLQPLVSLQTTITANEAGNAVVMTDTRANIHRVAEIIKAIDTGAQAVTEVRVFHLNYADPVEMATLLGSLFPSDSSSSQTPVRFGGGGGGGGGRFAALFGGGGGGGGGGNSTGASTSDRIKKMQRVLAVADQRTASVVVSAPNDLMDQISRMITQLDNNPAKRQGVYVFHLENADPSEVLPVLQDMFQKNTTSRSSSSRSSGQSQLMSRSTSTTTSGAGSLGSSSTSGGGGGGGFGGGGGGYGGGGGRTGGGGGAF